MPEFGEILRQVRKSLNMSQGELALTLSSTQRHISFLETGRSELSRSMLGRLTTDLALSTAQRSALFEASPFKSPYVERDLSTPDVTQVLDMLERRMLTHWPFPGFVMSHDMTVLRLNTAAQRMFGAFGFAQNEPLNMLVVFTSEPFRQNVINWETASASLMFRLQQHASTNPTLAEQLRKLRAEGLFDHVSEQMVQTTPAPIFTPLELALPNGALIRTTSLLAKLGTVHDALVEGFEIELLMPVDEPSEAIMLAAGA